MKAKVAGWETVEPDATLADRNERGMSTLEWVTALCRRWWRSGREVACGGHKDVLHSRVFDLPRDFLVRIIEQSKPHGVSLRTGFN
jgi:hypothetical protein